MNEPDMRLTIEVRKWIEDAIRSKKASSIDIQVFFIKWFNAQYADLYKMLTSQVTNQMPADITIETKEGKYIEFRTN